jgi:hypothetical protein
VYEEVSEPVRFVEGVDKDGSGTYPFPLETFWQRRTKQAHVMRALHALNA